MMSKTPIELNKIGKRKADMEIMRTAIIAELDAINLYEQLAAQTSDRDIKRFCGILPAKKKLTTANFTRCF